MRFWDASGVCLRLLYKLSTVHVFFTDTDPSENLNAQGEEEWPPLRKVRPGAWQPGGWGQARSRAHDHSRACSLLSGGLL